MDSEQHAGSGPSPRPEEAPVLPSSGLAPDGAAERDGGPVRAGGMLREQRLRSGRSIEDCAIEMRARASQVEALERGDLGGFGGDVYARGFLRSYARLLGVDPSEVLDLHGSDPAFEGPTAPSEPLRLRRVAPSWLVGMLGVVLVAGVLVGVVVLGGQRAPEPTVASDPALEVPGTGPAVPEDGPELSAGTDPPGSAGAEQEVVGPPIDLVLTFEAASWLEVLVDGVPAVMRAGGLIGDTVPAGETLRFTAQDEVILRFGNAGGVRVESSGADLGSLGRPGQVVRVVFGPDGRVDGDG